MTRSIAVALIALTGALGTATRASGQGAEPHRPRLVVVIAIDQFRPDYLQRFSKFFGPGGFNLLLRKGADFTESHYQYSVTQTCPGHAVMLTGSYANMNGIVANTWYDTASHKSHYCAADSLAKLIGVSGDGRSPRSLVDSTVGDVLKRSNGQSRVITISGKDRSAIMLGGHRADAAYWTEDTLLVSSTYYMKELPPWVRSFNAAGRVSRYRGATWNRILPESAYSIAGSDDVPTEASPGGMGRTFPHHLADGGSSLAEFLAGFQSSPFEDELLVDFVMEAITQEHLGQDDQPDLLGLGFSANDLVGHAYGPDSHEMMDITIRTDRMLERLFTFLDQRIGLDRIVIVLTSDHGVAPLPELAAKNVGAARGGRFDPAVVVTAAENALQTRYGTPRRPAAAAQPRRNANHSWPWLYLNLEGLKDKRLSVEDAERIAEGAIRHVPGVERVLTASELRRERAAATHSRAELSFYPGRSGNLYVVLAPYLLPVKEPEGTTHGSPWEYDTHVPLLWLGSGSGVKPGIYSGAVSQADLAPTLSRLLGIPAPSGSEGRVLTEMLP